MQVEAKLAQLAEYETRLLRELKKVRQEQDALRGILDEQVRVVETTGHGSRSS